MFLSQNEKSHRFVAQHPASECKSVEGQAAAAQQCLFFSTARTFPTACVAPPIGKNVDLAFVQLHPQRSKRRVGPRRQFLPLSFSLSLCNKHQQKT